MDRPLTNQTMRSKHLAQSFSALPFQSMRPSGSERLSESCNGKIDTEPTGDPELTNLNWLSCLTPQSLGGPIYDVDNIASNEEILGSSMNSSSTEQSDVSQNLSHSTENPCIPVSPLGQDYQRFLEERKRSEGESRRFTQPNPVVMNPTSIMCNTSSQQQYSKPPLSFGALICLAIESSPRRKLPVREIYMWIEGNFPFYKNAPGMSWKNSVRHNLSLSKAFVKIPRDLPGGKGCLWGINDDYRNSLIASFRRSGLSYPLIFPLGGVPNEEKPGDDRSLPEYYSQAALEQQQYPPGLNNVAHQQVIPQNANLGPSQQQAFQQFQMFQQRQRQRMGQKRAVEDGDENHQQTLLRGKLGRRPWDSPDDAMRFAADLRFFNQAIKRTQALMFKESIDEGEEEEEEEELKDLDNDNSNDVLEEIPLESHGLTSEQIAELNHLARRGRRKKTRTIRHMTPCPSLDHDYCKVTLCTEDLFESETDEEAAAEEPQRPPPIVRRPRLSHSLSALHTARKRLQERSGRHKQLSWLGIRRPSFHSRALARSLQAEAVPRAVVSSGLPRRRRPGRPPKNRSNLVEREELERERRRRRKRETDSGSLADDEELDDALTEPMIDSDEEMDVDMDDDEGHQELNIDDIQAADILTKLKLNRMNFNNSMLAPNGTFSAMSLSGGNQTGRKEESLSEDEHPGRDSARSPENIPPASIPGPKRRGRKPRNDPSRLESLEKIEKSKPLAPKASQHDPNEDHLSSRSGLPKRQAAVNAPAVWKRKAKKMNK